MTPAEFLEKFELVAALPGALAGIRKLILSLATQGKLVKSDPRNESVESTLPKLAAVASPVSDSDPFPAHWRKVRLGVAGIWYGGGTPSQARRDFWVGDIPWVSPKDMKVLRIDDAEDHISETAVNESAVRMLPAGSLLMVVRGMILAKAFPVAQTVLPVTINQDMKALVLNERQAVPFLLVALRALEAQVLASVERSSHGTCKLRTEVLEHLTVPIPPLPEQKRIVAKVDELMALCDRLEAQQKERETRHAALARASVSRFAEAPTPANLTFLFHKSYAVAPEDLRKTVLRLAVQGDLVAANAVDESVKDSLRRGDERRCAVSKEDRRADEDEQSLLSADDRWPIPDGWEWRALADLVLFVDYRGKTPLKESHGIRLLTAKNVRPGYIKREPQEFLSESEYKSWMRRGLPKVGDVLFTTEAPMGNAAAVTLTERFALAQRVICFQSYGAIDSQFLVLQILSDQFQQLLDKNGTGVTAKGIKASKLKQLPIAVPPLAEQTRIVAKVDQLMALLDQLEAQLAASRTTAAKLFDAVVAELTA